MEPDGRLPVICGIGQVTNRDEITTAARLMEQASRAALDDAPGLVDHLDAVWVVNVMSGISAAPATDLAHQLGRPEAQALNTTVGGNTPARLVARAADAVTAGELGAVLIAGAEAMRSRRAVKDGAEAPADDVVDPQRIDRIIGDDRMGISPVEGTAGLVMPTQMYPVFEGVLAHRAGRDFAEQRAFLGPMMSRFADVAAKHPHAWFPSTATADDLATVDDDNRLVCQPYPKRMNAIMSVDQGAAVIVTTLDVARALGLAAQSVFAWSGASATDVFMVSERRDLGSSPGMAASVTSALDAAGVGADDLGHLDLYSCFPSVVQFGASTLGIELDDPRGLTVTGGLAYFGGPGNNYVTHSLATMVERLRGDGDALGLVTALGWFSTKHSAVVLGSEPPPQGWVHARTAAHQRAIDATAVEVVASASGPGVIAGCSVQAERDGSLAAARAIVDLPDGTRTVAVAAPDVLGALGDQVPVGWRVELDGSTPTVWSPA